jgi:hypothetical protein
VYCPECGHQNPDAANYCARCGALIVPDQPAGQTTMSYPPAEIENEDGELAGDLSESGPALVVRAGGGRSGELFVLDHDPITIGRSEDADVLLDDVTVSRSHAKVRRRPDGLYLEDDDSLNGTYVNRRRVESHRLSDGDEVQVGKFKLIYLER